MYYDDVIIKVITSYFYEFKKYIEDTNCAQK